MEAKRTRTRHSRVRPAEIPRADDGPVPAFFPGAGIALGHGQTKARIYGRSGITQLRQRALAISTTAELTMANVSIRPN